MIYHLKAFDLCVPKIASKNTKKVVDLTNDGLKSQNEKVQKSRNLHIHQVYPKLYLILKLSTNRFITNALQTVKLFWKKSCNSSRGGEPHHVLGVHHFMLSMSRSFQDHFGVKISSKSATVTS